MTDLAAVRAELRRKLERAHRFNRDRRREHAFTHEPVPLDDLGAILDALDEAEDVLREMTDKGEGCPACGTTGAVGCGCRYERARALLARLGQTKEETT